MPGLSLPVYTKPFLFIHSKLLYKANHKVMMRVTREFLSKGNALVGRKGQINLSDW